MMVWMAARNGMAIAVRRAWFLMRSGPLQAALASPGSALG